MRGRVATALMAIVLVACGSDDVDPVVLVDLGGLPPGEIIALRSDGETIEWIERTAGRIVRLAPDAAPSTVATLDVSTDGEQRGLLGHTVIEGRRFAAWTERQTLRLVVGELTDDGPELVWRGTGTATRAVGGHLEERDGMLVLGLGELTDWAQDHGSGAIVTLDPDGAPAQDPVVLTDGWNNPFAFVVLDDGTVLVADNAPAGSPERLAADELRTDLPAPERAPSAIAALPDGRIGVCGWLDGELRGYELTDDGFERAGTPGTCRSAVTVTAEGRIVTVTDDAIVATP
ncbi:MAG: hypothetical protein AAGD18_15900 [Actinomycetota bacterium]